MAVNIDQLRQNQLNGLTVGVVPQDGSTKLRLELDDLLQDADVTNLYLLALIELMKPGVWQDPFSWFQITGMCLVYDERICPYSVQEYMASLLSHGMESLLIK